MTCGQRRLSFPPPRPLCPMSRLLLRTMCRSQSMGRIAYLSKRGNIWWFRRRHPVIFMGEPQNRQVSGACGAIGRKAQAKGHLAVSLQTSSSREARLLGTRLSDHFERAWAFFEAGADTMTNEDDPLAPLRGLSAQPPSEQQGQGLRRLAGAANHGHGHERAATCLAKEARKGVKCRGAPVTQCAFSDARKTATPA